MIRKALLAAFALWMACSSLVNAETGAQDGVEPDADRSRLFTFSWPYAAKGAMAPRGGTTKGPDLELQTQPTEDWLALRNDADRTGYEQDRLAILAMAGTYRASFDFLETVGFAANYEAPRPYQSWGTEKVYVIADEPGYISLQHLLVMQIKQEDGTLTDPFVVKHWRQDWTYEDRSMHVYQGNRRWALEKLSRKAAKGGWSQAVFQVDDSPRYEGFGRWQHEGGVSTWLSSETWRPLPRREFSIRDDYDVLVGTNRHTITPTGWVHEEHNYKVVLNDDGEVDTAIAKEAGFNRYERINGYDWSAGDQYWKKTAPFWAAVRSYWDEQLTSKRTLTVTEAIDEKPMMFKLFALADSSAGATDAELELRAQDTIAPYVSP